MSTKLFSIANILSFLRLGLVPVLGWLAASGEDVLFLWVLGVCLISDALDGYLARKLDQTSELGAKFDLRRYDSRPIPSLAGHLLRPINLSADGYIVLLSTFGGVGSKIR